MSDWTAEQGPMPALYIGHGAPPLLDDRLWTAELSALAGSMPRPRTILIGADSQCADTMRIVRGRTGSPPR